MDGRNPRPSPAILAHLRRALRLVKENRQRIERGLASKAVIVGFQPAPEIRAWRFEFDRFGRADDYRELTIGLLAGETIANEPDSGAADAGTVRQWEQVKEWQWKHWRLRRAAGGWSKSA